MTQARNKHRAGKLHYEPTYLPTSEEITTLTEQIRAGWSEAEWESRLVCGHTVHVSYEPLKFRNLE